MSGIKPWEWQHIVRDWLAGQIGPDGEQIALPGMPAAPHGPGRRMVLLTLSLYASADGTGVRPGLALLMRVADVSRWTALRAIHGAEQAGLIEDVGPPPAPGRTRVYRLARPAWARPTGSTSGTRQTVERVAPAAPVEPQRVAPDPPTGSTSEPERVAPAHPYGGIDGVDGGRRVASQHRVTDQRPRPYCPQHPGGTDRPCGACRAARAAWETWQADARPDARSVAAVLSDSDACDHGYLTPRDCPVCRRAVAS